VRDHFKINGCIHLLYFTDYPKGVGMDLLYNVFKDFGTICFVAVTGESAVIEFVEQ
jgi:hypothetical protein